MRSLARLAWSQSGAVSSALLNHWFFGTENVLQCKFIRYSFLELSDDCNVLVGPTIFSLKMILYFI